MKIVIYFCGTNVYGPNRSIIRNLCVEGGDSKTIVLTVPGCAYYHTPWFRFLAPGTTKSVSASSAITGIEDRNSPAGSVGRTAFVDVKHDAAWMKSMFFAGASMRDNVEGYAARLRELGASVGTKYTCADRRGASERLPEHLAIYPSAIAGDCQPEELESIILCGFSRGGVMSFILADMLYQDYKLRAIPVYISAMEPVPGNFVTMRKLKSALNFLPFRSNALEAGNLKRCHNIKCAVIYLGHYDSLFMKQIIPTFSIVTKTRVFVCSRAKKHGGGVAKFLTSFNKDVALFMKNDFRHLEIERLPPQLEQQEYPVCGKTFSIHMYQNELTKDLPEYSVARALREDSPYLINDESLRKMLGELVQNLRGKGSFVLFKEKKFKNFEIALQRVERLSFNDLNTAEFIQSIVQEAFRQRGVINTGVSSTGYALAKELSLSGIKKYVPDKYRAEHLAYLTTQYGYLGIWINAMTHKYDMLTPAILDFDSVSIEYVEELMCMRLMMFMEYSAEELLENLERVEEVSQMLELAMARKCRVDISAHGELHILESRIPQRNAHGKDRFSRDDYHLLADA
ncbi:hypothetical protein [Fangia hongkongensis]|uniref:hypothetical protein n=1 Tax=Fangia hongkongensis TaxID=270495 RepID=UPI00036A8DDF|nr:hypothetical protein [Fangia hongkongensis]MBK2125827.1 hypothetical protein [Fangia hongkongensis]